MNLDHRPSVMWGAAVLGACGILAIVIQIGLALWNLFWWVIG